MEWLSGWLRELILVVLLATFVDMLLPNRSMERYVKLVLSLLILLTLITPLINLLSSEPDARLKEALRDWTKDGGQIQAMTLDDILDQGEKLHKQQDLKAREWAAKEVADQIKEQIERETELPVESVSVILGTEKKTDKSAELTSITSVKVTMGQSNEDRQITMSSENGPIEITPVDQNPISVRISDLTNEEDAPEERPYDSGEEAVSVMTGTEADQITSLIEGQWQVDAKHIVILKPERNTEL
ncbi:stage III sporulation protein AF [Paenibacillus sp. An7]|uniref:stage III sporulation protein AF n=1 Tax=Paenibacillus sp. An7 TaxID=2689577 RepID=UPI0013567E0E|nr:stage III sporulation protein AF [Paenibacillus sp. An7]